MTPDSPSQNQSSPRPPRARKLTARQWSVRFAAIVIAVCALAWSWERSGMGDVRLLWSNRDRAAEYLLGRKVDDVSPDELRVQALREIRTDFQSEATAELTLEYETQGIEPPGLMVLMRESEQRARERLDALSPSEIDALVDQRIAMATSSGRQGGFFPPESDPVAIFGDPDDLEDLPAAVAWILDAADDAGEPTKGIVRWTFAAITGDGYTGQLFETIAIAIWGTLIAVIFAIPACLLGSPVTMQILWSGRGPAHHAMRWFGRFVVRRSFDISRGFNEIILAMILVAVLGLGPLPGVLALAIHTYGVLGKVFAEAIETIDRKPVEGVLSTGAAASQVISFAVMTQITPYIISQSLLRFEANVRGATILGVVGAGGIGQLLMDKFGAYEYQEVATMMVLIIIVVTIIDFGCTAVIRKFV